MTIFRTILVSTAVVVTAGMVAGTFHAAGFSRDALAVVMKAPPPKPIPITEPNPPSMTPTRPGLPVPPSHIVQPDPPKAGAVPEPVQPTIPSTPPAKSIFPAAT